MCGIVGILGRQPAAVLLLDALKRLEYRGYDSAGIATLVNGGIERRRAEGKLVNLERALEQEPLPGVVGIGHALGDAWRADPRQRAPPPGGRRRGGAQRHHREFPGAARRADRQGHRFETETDTEVIPQLVSHYLAQGIGPVAAAAAALKRLDGAFALAILFAGHDDLLIGARRGSPLAIGYGDGEMYLGSDALALAPLTNRIQYLEEGDWAVLNPRGAAVYDAEGQPVEREIKQTALSGALIGKGNYRHFMHKEIHEQPAVIGDTLRTFASPVDHRITLPELPVDFATLPRLVMVACGTAYYACMVAKYWFEQLAGLPVDLDIGSEFRYRDTPLVPASAALFVSQSGETADTLAAMRHVKRLGLATVGLVNVPESTLAREVDCHLRTLAGPRSAWRRPKPSPPSWRRSPVSRSARRRRAAGSAPSASASSPRRSTRYPRAAEVLLQDHEYERIAHQLVPPATCCTSAAAPATRSPSKARSSSRRSATSTPRATPPASSSMARSR